ncbi:hypothetical protein VME_07960 [Vibrio harveyi 1DA3]|nr:hypothetical protein VME_07960 [Vibrio harveyi 1DA3]
MYAAQNHEPADTNYAASETFYKLTQHDYHALKVPYRAWNTRDAWSPDGYYRHLKRDLFGSTALPSSFWQRWRIDIERRTRVSPTGRFFVPFLIGYRTQSHTFAKSCTVIGKQKCVSSSGVEASQFTLRV